MISKIVRDFLKQNCGMVAAILLTLFLTNFTWARQILIFVNLSCVGLQYFLWFKAKDFRQIYINLPLMLFIIFMSFSIVVHGSGHEFNSLFFLLISSFFFWLQLLIWLFLIIKTIRKKLMINKFLITFLRKNLITIAILLITMRLTIVSRVDVTLSTVNALLIVCQFLIWIKSNKFDQIFRNFFLLLFAFFVSLLFIGYGFGSESSSYLFAILCFSSLFIQCLIWFFVGIKTLHKKLSKSSLKNAD